jgi:hypothetical protein
LRAKSKNLLTQQFVTLPVFYARFKKITYGGASSISFLSQCPLFVPSPLKAGLFTAIGAAFPQPFNPMKQKIRQTPHRLIL